MRLRVLSDLHLEHFDGHRELPPAEADVVVLAGDIHRRAEGAGMGAAAVSRPADSLRAG